MFTKSEWEAGQTRSGRPTITGYVRVMVVSFDWRQRGS